MAYGICRIKKLKTWGELGASEDHTTRHRETLNADPSVSNIRLIGSPDDPNLETMVKAKISNQKIRSNAVLTAEILLSASPEYFRPDDPSRAGVYDQKRLDNFAAACTKWLTEQYRDKVIRAELHLDEVTPHIHAYLVPLNEKGKLNCRELFGGRKKLSELQDSFASAVEHLGIARGTKGSIATHTEIKDYYADVNRDSLKLNLERELPSAHLVESAVDYRERVKKTLQPTLDIVNHQLSDRQLAHKQRESIQQKALASKREQQKLKKRIEELEEELIKWKAQANQLQDLPLEDVAYELELDQDSKDKDKWRGNGHNIHISGSKFYDPLGKQQREGNGAVDLVMHIKSYEFREAVSWLSDRFGDERMLRAVTYHARVQAQQIALLEPALKFIPPPPDESRWQVVQQYLTRDRGLPENLVKGVHQQGLVYADSFSNAVFVHRSIDGETTGASLRDTADKDNKYLGLAPGSKRSVGWFYLRQGGKETDLIQKAVLTNSPVEALSYLVLHKTPEIRTLYLAAPSPRSLPLDFLKEMPAVIAAYSNDPPSNETAKQIKQMLPQAIRVRPLAKDWNEDLATRQRHRENLEID